MSEAIVIINGRRLDMGQTMTLHVAIQAYLSDMTPTEENPHPLGDDHHGRVMAEAYAQRCREITAIMHPDAVAGVARRIE